MLSLLALVLVLAGCSSNGASQPALVLVSRQFPFPAENLCEGQPNRGERCRFIFDDVELRSENGVEARLARSEVVLAMSGGDSISESCGGQEFNRAFVQRGVLPEGESAPSRTLEMDDGRSALLFLDAFKGLTRIEGVLCAEWVGRWEGTAGSLAGRSGTYSSVDNRIQTTLTLHDS